MPTALVGTPSQVGSYSVNMVTATDYTPFGMIMQGRNYNSVAATKYRYGFNGKEWDNEPKSNGNQIDYGMRMYDPRVGRFLSVDPLTKKFAKLSPYQYASNRPTVMIDLDGMEGSMGLNGSANVSQQGYSMVEFDSDGDWKPNYGKGWAGGGLATFATGESLLLGGYGYLNFWSIWASVMFNPVVQTEIVGGLAGLSGYQGPDIPSPGFVMESTVSRTWSQVKLTRSNGRVIAAEVLAEAKLIMHEGSSFATQAEKSMAQKLLSEGNTVEILAESTEKGVRTADYIINGVQTELKTVSNIKKTDAENLSNTLSQTIKRSKGQGNSIILDVSGQEGATKEVAERALKRYWKQGSNKSEVRIVGDGYDQAYKKTDFYPQ